MITLMHNCISQITKSNLYRIKIDLLRPIFQLVFGLDVGHKKAN